MLPELVRADFAAPLARIAERVDTAIEGLRAYSDSPVWAEAVRATLAISRAPKHLIRSQLVLLGSLAGGGAAEGAVIERFTAGVELLHLFMLAHDDVMDHAMIRRGEPTVRVALTRAHPAIGVATARDLAIVMGDVLNVIAMRHLVPGAGASAGEARACELILESCCRAGAGQFQDLLGFRGIGDDEAALRRELVDKTAYQAFAAPFGAGMHLGGSDGARVEAAIAWGCHVGLAFQAADDVVDLFGSPAVTGKDGLRDLLEGRPSLPLLLLSRRATGDDREFVASLVGKETVAPGERARLYDLVRAAGVAQGSLEYVKAEIDAGAALAEKAGFPGEAREGMRAIERGLVAYLERIVRDAERDD